MKKEVYIVEGLRNEPDMFLFEYWDDVLDHIQYSLEDVLPGEKQTITFYVEEMTEKEIEKWREESDEN